MEQPLQRPLEFKAYNFDTKQWNKVAQYNVLNSQLVSRKGDHQIIVQFTGKLDGKGKKIFEGDILDYYGIRKFVCWRELYLQWGLKRKLDAPDKIAEELSQAHLEKMFIIGNIFQNEDLLYEKQYYN